jgi:hypothetical protein
MFLPALSGYVAAAVLSRSTKLGSMGPTSQAVWFNAASRI